MICRSPGVQPAVEEPAGRRHPVLRRRAPDVQDAPPWNRPCHGGQRGRVRDWEPARIHHDKDASSTSPMHSKQQAFQRCTPRPSRTNASTPRSAAGTRNLALTGDDVGTPIIAMDTPATARASLGRPPGRPEFPTALDGMVAMMSVDGFWELKRATRRPGFRPAESAVPLDRNRRQSSSSRRRRSTTCSSPRCWSTVPVAPFCVSPRNRSGDRRRRVAASSAPCSTRR